MDPSFLLFERSGEGENIIPETRTELPVGSRLASTWIEVLQKGKTVMETREIPRNEWTSFFDVFNQQHEGWLATLEVFGPEVGAQEEARDLPFEGVSLASSDNELETIAISLARNPEDHLSHTIIKPEHVWFEQNTQVENVALEIESADDTKTLMRFRSPLRLAK